jgi:RHS repeat-associated protein
MKALILILCSVLLGAVTTFAGDGTWVKRVPITSLYAGQYTIFEPQRASGEDTRSYNKMRAFVRLNYSRKMQSDRTHGYDWNLIVNFTYLVNGVTTNGSVVVKNETSSRVYEDYQEIPLPDAALGCAVTITSVTASYGALNAGATNSAPSPQTSAFIPDDIDFILELRSERVYNLNTSTASLDDISRISFTPADYKLYWDFQQGAEEYDLEWVFIDKYSPEYAQVIANEPSTPTELVGYKLPFELQEPTRVRVWGNSYQLDKTFPEGRLYFRVRSVSTFADQTTGISDDIRTGKWGYCVHGPTTLALCKYEVSDVLQFDVTKTWIYGVSYADDGKCVSTLTYFDGSNRGRQNLTYNTSDNVTLVGESKYDNEGRQTVNVIPAPIAGRNLLYRQNFNMAGAGNVFDEGEIEQDGVPPLATISGSAKYFSPENDLTGDLFRDAIPNANGYVFSQTIFRNDGTGRIEKVGGIGPDFQTNGTHAVQTWYGSTNVVELKRLFGDNVSDMPHGYRKDMIQDANGQLSVTYYDKRGNTIATGLAGKAPSSLRKLDYTEEVITTPLNDNNVKIGNSIISEHTFLNTLENTDITLSYSLDREGQNISEQILVIEGHELTIGSFCPDCIYKLRIEVKDQDGATIGTPVNETIHTIDACDVTDYGITNYTVNLPNIGEYRIIKTLTVDEASMIAAFQAQLDAQGTSSFDSFLQDYLTTVDFTACLTECEDLCAYSVRLDYIQQHGEAAWMSLTKSQMTALVDACIGIECDAENHDSEEEPLLEVDSDEACAAQRERMIHQISPGGVLYDDFSSSFWSALGNGTVTINGTSYTVADLQNPNIYNATIAAALLPYHREYCIWNNHCQKWMQVQNASLYLTTKILNTDWPSSAPASGTIFADPYLSSFDHANAVFGTLLTLQSLVNNYGSNNNYPSDSYCGTSWPAITSGNLYAVCEALGNRLASQHACLGTPMTTDQITLLKKQLFLGFYLNIKWKMVKQYAGCTFYDDHNAIFMIPPASIGSMQSIIDNALDASINLKSCHEKAIDNVNIWMGTLPAGCLTALGTNFTSITDYNSTAALSLQSAYSSSSTSGGLVQLFYNYSRAVCEATTASTPVNPNVLGMFYDPDPDNSIVNAPGEVQYDAIKTLLAATGCNYSITTNLPFEVNPPVIPGGGSGSGSIAQQDLEDALNELIHEVTTCTTCTTSIMYDNVWTPPFTVKYVNNYVASNGLVGSIRYAKRGIQYNGYGYPDEYYFEFKLAGEECSYKTVKFDNVPPVPIEQFDYLFSQNYSSLYFMGLSGSSFAEPFYGNPDPNMDLKLDVNSNGFGYYVTANRHIASQPKLVTDCPGSSPPSGELGGSFEVINALIPNLDSQMEIDCILTQIQQATADAQVIYNQVIEDLWSQFYDKMKSCLDVVEDFGMTYKLLEYQYTLYYYDLAGNLVQTVPPQGVKPFTSDQVNGYLEDNGHIGDYPPHNMETRYVYNGLNALVSSYTPDGGRSDLYLDKLYRVRFSQNAQQRANSNASYSKYDELGRVIEAGEFRKQATEDLALKADVATFPFERIMDYTHTFYEEAYYPPTSSTMVYPASTAYDAVLATQFGANGQQNLRNAVGAVVHRQADFRLDANGTPLLNGNGELILMDGTNVLTVISYSYDPHKNVKQMVSSNYHLASIGMQHKRTDYKYDLISGNIEEVCYQKGASDEYRHRYHYDANNRLVRAYTSHNGDFWELDAKYFYYLHGSLARRELGHDQVQGTDYAYNLQGWLKGVNSTTLDRTRDIGKDGNSGTDNQYFGIDAFGFSLGYFTNDYQAIKDAIESPEVYTNDYFAGTSVVTVQNQNPDASNASMASLYNGNITHMVTAMRDHNEMKLDVLANNYQYDQLQRLREMKVYSATNLQTNNDFTGALLYRAGLGSESAFQESYTFDKNGNLRSLKRNGDGLGGISLPMDNFTYMYYTHAGSSGNPITMNRLGGAMDAVMNDPYSGDIENGQSNTNYGYNANGQLTKDVQENISTIEWTVTGKVKRIRYSNGDPDVKFFYDPMDRRVAKMEYENPEHTSIKWTYYTYDAGGNVMATYKRTRKYVNTTNNLNNYIDEYSINDHLIYGADRLGSEVENVILFSEKYTQASTLSKDVEVALGWNMVFPPRGATPPDYTRRLVGDKRYELANQLGNVLEVITDRKVRFTDNSVLVYSADVVSYSDYSPYGTLLGSRHGNDDTYRYGFQGQERDDEIKGTGNSYNYEYRMHDPRIGRFFAIDPLAAKYPYYSPYAFSGNRVIDAVELEGLEPALLSGFYNSLKYNWVSVYMSLYKKTSAFKENSSTKAYGQKNVTLTKDMVLDAAKDATDGLFWFENMGYVWAGRNLNHYLLGFGGVDIYGYDEIKDVKSFEVSKNDINESVSQDFIEKTKNLKKGETLTIPISQYGSYDDNRETDAALAFGATQMLAEGEINVKKNNKGKLEVWGSLNYTFYDTYDWGPERRGGGLKQLMGIADHWQMNDLKNVGAKDFYSRAYVSAKIWMGKDGFLKFGAYKDAIDTKGFAEPVDKTFAIPQGTQVIYDGRRKI